MTWFSRKKDEGRAQADTSAGASADALGRIDDVFTRLAGEATSTPSSDVVNRLWKAVFDLEHWHFINQFPPDGSKPEGPPPFGWPRPMSARVDGKLYVIAFTSAERATAAAKLNHLSHPQFGIPAANARLAKVLDVQTMKTRIEVGDPNLSGFHTERQYVEDLLGGQSTTQQWSDRLRLDRTASPILPNSPRVILETKMTATMRTNARIPRSSGYSNESPLEFVEDLPHPNGGHGLVLTKDGHDVPETTMAATAMDAGEELGVPVTIARFQFADGTPYQQTIGGKTASDWQLSPHPTDPELFLWKPYP